MTRYIISILFLLLPLFTHAQLPTDIIVLHKIAQEGKALVLDLTVDLTHVSLSKCHSLVFTPVVTKGDSATAFPAIVVNGKERQKLYRRLKRPATEQAYTIEHAHKVPCLVSLGWQVHRLLWSPIVAVVDGAIWQSLPLPNS